MLVSLNIIGRVIGVLAICLIPSVVHAEKNVTAAEKLARLLQDPLANISAVATDNSIYFGQGPANNTGYNFQIQPVYSIPTKMGFSVIPRAVIPIVGAPPASDFPRLGEPRPSGGVTTWGLSDIITQVFFAPSGLGSVKWGVGPQISYRTRTDARVGGAGWGAGPSAVLLGSAGSWGYGALVSHLWGQNSFSTTIIQPFLYYNLNAIPGAYVGYNNSISVDWDATSRNRFSVPVGLTAGKAFDLAAGYGLDLSLGLYGFADRPAGGPDWQLKFGMTIVIPR